MELCYVCLEVGGRGLSELFVCLFLRWIKFYIAIPRGSEFFWAGVVLRVLKTIFVNCSEKGSLGSWLCVVEHQLLLHTGKPGTKVLWPVYLFPSTFQTQVHHSCSFDDDHEWAKVPTYPVQNTFAVKEGQGTEGDGWRRYHTVHEGDAQLAGRPSLSSTFGKHPASDIQPARTVSMKPPVKSKLM